MATRQATGARAVDTALATPPPGTTVVVHWGRLAANSPLPRDRAVHRWVLDRAQSTNVWVAVLEPVLGSSSSPELDAAGVTTIAKGLRTASWLTHHRSHIDVVVCTDLELAGLVATADVTRRWMLADDRDGVAGLAPVIEDVEAAGRHYFDDARRARDAATRHAFERVVRVDDEPPMVAPTRGPDDSIVLVDCLVTDRSGAAEAGLRWFTSVVMPRLRSRHPHLRFVVAALDGAITRRAIDADALCGMDDAWAAIGRAAAVVVCRTSPAARALVYELALAGVDAVEFDPGEDVDAFSARCSMVLERSRRAPLAAATWRAPSRQGSGAAHRPSVDRFAREIYGTQQLPWMQALIANSSFSEPDRYRLWWSVHHSAAARPSVGADRAARLTYRPRISVVVPVHDTEPDVLRAMVDSVCEQTYPRWELCLVDDASTRADTRATLTELAGADTRIRLTRLDTAAGIVGATNAAIAMATGAYVAFVDHDDVLAPTALYWIARRLELDGGVDVVYSDEDKIDERGARVEPYFKPDWSPDYLLSLNYVTHLLVVRRSLIDEVGGLREGFDGAQDYDLLLRLTERTDRIAHIPAPLYSWRKVAGSTAADIHAKPDAHRASERALDDALVRRGIDGERVEGLQPTWHRVRYRIDHRPLVSVVIPTRDRVDLLERCVDRVRDSTKGTPVEYVIVDNESREAATLDYLERVDRLGDVRVVRYPFRFNFARQMNLAALEAAGAVLLLLNNDVRPISPGWFDALLEHALRPEVGAVGARLLWPDGRAQHEGIVLNAGGVALNLNSGPFAAYGRCIRNVAAATAACLMVRKSVFAAVGGMDDRLRVAYNDVDLCLRIGERGWRIVYTPYAELEHRESSTRGSLHPEIDETFFQSRWGAPYTSFDPFYTPNLELMQPWSPRL